jgi:tRNA-2-methylthio-N6-dimethylallyladenosine synthase
MKNKRYHIETMGCQMNERDSETVAGMLEELGYAKADDRASADVIVVNTCSVRENADNRFFGLLGSIKKYKEADPDKLVAVCGCMMQLEPVTSRIRDRFPWVDIVFGTLNIDSFPSLLTDALGRNAARRRTAFDVAPEAGGIVEGLPSRRRHPYKAFVNIMYGCDNYCTYCIVPYTRGRERSRAPGAVIEEVRALAEDGVNEIMLLGQNVNSYSGGELDFPGLLARLDDIPGIERIRFMTSHPKDLSGRLVDCFGEGGLRHLCPQIHLPIQSGSTEVLHRMNRGYTKEDYLALVAKLRAARPDIVITTDLIVGFPGETEEDFEETMDVIERVRFDAAFTFLYSPRTGTPAAGFDGQVPGETAHRRFDRMVERLNAITMEKNRALVGSVQEILVEGPSKTTDAMQAGRTPGGKLVNIRASAAEAPAGSIMRVRLTEAATFSFKGELL